MGDTGSAIRVLLFARLRETAGRAELEVPVAGPATARDIWAAVVALHPGLGPSDPPGEIRAAIDEEYCAWTATVAPGSTVAFLPPVAGGAQGPLGPGRVVVRVTAEPIDARALEDDLRSDSDGAVCTFTGRVRARNEHHDVTGLDYEAYVPMAEAEMRRIAEETLTLIGASGLALVHRVGSLAVGDASVVVSAVAEHRAEAFEACRRALDEVKRRVPIWKREHTPQGAIWVRAAQLTPDQPAAMAPAAGTGLS